MSNQQDAIDREELLVHIENLQSLVRDRWWRTAGTYLSIVEKQYRPRQTFEPRLIDGGNTRRKSKRRQPMLRVIEGGAS